VKILLIGIGIVIIGALFVIQDFGSLTTSDPVQSQPTPQPSPEPEEPKELGIAAFVDPTKDPQSYVDRYNNEPTYKKWFDSNYYEYESIYEAVGIEEPIPEPTSQPPQSQQVQSQNQCDSSYPSVCIPPYPPDLDCGEIDSYS